MWLCMEGGAKVVAGKSAVAHDDAVVSSGFPASPALLNARESSAPVVPLLRRFYEPQVEQLGMSPVAQAGGVTAGGANQYGRGELWAQQLGESCLVVAHSVTLRSDFALEEESPESLCVASISCDGVPLCPIPATPKNLRRNENVAVFEQGSRTVSHLRAGDQFNSVAVCMLPAYFNDLRKCYGKEVARRALALMSAPGGVRMGGSEPYVRAALRSLGAVRSASPAVRRMLARKVDGMMALLALEDYEAHRAFDLQGCAGSARMVAQVRCLVEADPAHAPTVDALAELAGVSRARLCAVFKQETGESVGAFVTRRRMELACHLLQDETLSIADVAQACGYQHQSSFTDAFRRTTGKTPRQWRTTTSAN